MIQEGRRAIHIPQYVQQILEQHGFWFQEKVFQSGTNFNNSETLINQH